MALPKRKVSKSRRNKRRAHKKLSAPTLSPCPNCDQPRPSHQVCPECGYYDGRQVVTVSTE